MNYDVSHLFRGDSVGTLPSEGLLMYALVKVLNPRVIVEFGFAKGYSSGNFLRAMSADSKLYSFDPDINAYALAKTWNDPRFKFVLKRGEDFKRSDIDNNNIDMVFIDASHELLSNVKIFHRIRKSLAPDCLIMIHDTGLFNRDFMDKEWVIDGSFYVTDKGYAQRPGERLFVNFLKWRYPKFDQIHFHSMTVECMGITMLKRYQKLI